MLWSGLSSALSFSTVGFQSAALEFERWLNFSDFYSFFFRKKSCDCHKRSWAKMAQDEQWLPMGTDINKNMPTL